MLNWDRVDTLESRKVLEDDCHVEVLDSKDNSLENHTLDVIYVHHEEWEFTDCNQTIFRWSNLDHLLLRAPKERQIVDWDIYRQLLSILLCSLLDQFAEGQELAVKPFALLPLLFLLLEFIHIVQLTRALKIDVLSCHT